MLKALLVSALVGLCVALDDQSLKFDLVNKINQQISYELRASYFYKAYSHYFERSDVALPGLAKWFEKASLEERDHATGLMEYLNKRGAGVELNSLNYKTLCAEIMAEATFSNSRNELCICNFMSAKGLDGSTCGDRNTWKNALMAMEDTLALERMVNRELRALHREADVLDDAHLVHVLEHHYLDEQVDAIKKVSDYITQLKRVGDGLGEYVFDKEL